MLKSIYSFTRFVCLSCFPFECFLWLFLTIQVYGIDNYRVTQISTDKGLSNNQVNAVLQDSKGFMWFGTAEGLNRYDGYEFVVFKNIAGDASSLSDNHILSLYEDQQKNLWIGTLKGGLNRYNRQTGGFKCYRKQTHNIGGQCDMISDMIEHIVEDSKGNLWMTCGYDYYMKFDVKQECFKPIRIGGRITNRVRSIYITALDEVFVGTGMGIFEYIEKSGIHQVLIPWEKAHFVNYKGHGLVKDIYQGNDEGIWTATRNGINIYDRKGNYKPYIPTSTGKHTLVNHVINKIMESRNGKLWIGTKRGLNIIDGDDHIAFLDSRSLSCNLSDNNILSIYEDKGGSVWVGTALGGVNVIRENPFHKLEPEASIHSKMVHAVLEDGSKLWVGTESGPICYNKNTKGGYIRSVSPLEQEINNKTISIFRDSRGYLYFGTYGGGLFVAHGDQVIKHLNARSKPCRLSHNEVYCFFEDDEGIVWVGTWNGVVSYDVKRNKTHIYNLLPKRDDLVYSITSDHYGDLWFGTQEGLFVRRRGRNIISRALIVNDNQKITQRAINKVLAKNDDLWVGTQGEGMVRISLTNDSIINIFKQQDGLSNNMVASMEYVSGGDLWVSTANGISVMDIKNETFRTYHAEEGLFQSSFIGGASHRSSAGQLFFGGTKGVNYFNPSWVIKNKQKPQLAITGLKILNKQMDPGDFSNQEEIDVLTSEMSSIRLTGDQKIFSLSFSALDFASPNKNRYAYFLEGIDKALRYTDADNRRVTYMNLDPGKYTFHVQGSNNDGIWNRAGVSLYIEVMPDWYQTYWFRGILICFLIGGVWAYIAWSRRSKLVLAQKVMARTQELSMANDQLSLKTKQLEKTTQELKANKKEIKEIADEMHQQDQMKLKLFTNISHEFRTPLTLINGAMNKLADDVIHTQERDASFEVIRKNTRRLLKLVSQLMDVRKLETGQYPLNYIQGDINMFVIKVLSLFKVKAENRDIDFVFDPSASPLIANFDKDVLEKTLINLISNAFKFTANGGRVAVCLKHMASTRNWKQDVTQIEREIDKVYRRKSLHHRKQICCDTTHLRFDDQGYILISISDNGIGIEDIKLDKVFDRFYQVSSTATERYYGSGIGLSLVKELIELHHGELILGSKVEQGTSVFVILPMGSQIERSHVEHLAQHEVDIDQKTYNATEEDFAFVLSKDPVTEIQDRKAPLLLLAEDNRDLSEYLVSELKDDYNLLAAYDGQTALDLATKKGPDIIVSDIMMPIMDGFELCKRIKSNAKTNHIPVLFLSARAEEEDINKGLQVRADAYISKPFEMDHLKATIWSLLENRKLLNQKFNHFIYGKLDDFSLNQRDKAFAEKTIKLIEENMADDSFHVDQFVTKMGMSKTALYEKIKILTGQSVAEFLRSIRLKKAAELLLTRQYTAAQVSSKVGFKAASHFSRCFSEKFGTTPIRFVEENIPEEA